MSERDGISNMMSSIVSSTTARSPRAPVLRSTERSAIARIASFWNVSATSSMSNSRWYCLRSAFRGFCRISTSVSASSGSRLATTGSRPTSSGISP